MPCAHHKHDNVDGIVRNEPWVDHEREFVKVCHCELCVKGLAEALMERLRKHFAGTNMQLVACPSPGRGCEKGNSLVINDLVALIKDLDRIEERVDRELARQRDERAKHPERNQNVVKVCFGPSCGMKEAKSLEHALWKQYNNDATTRVMRCGCTGNCSKANNVVVNGNIINRQSPLHVVRNVEVEVSRQRKEHARNSGPISAKEAEEILRLGF